MAAYDYTSGGFPASPAADDTLAMKGTTYKYNGSAWEVQTGGTTSYTYTATSGQTAFTGADTGSKTLAYTAASLHVFLNGVLLDAADYTATDGTTVTLGTGASTGDTLQIVAYGVLVSAGGGGGAWEEIENIAISSGTASIEMGLTGYTVYKLIYNMNGLGGYTNIHLTGSEDNGSTYISSYFEHERTYRPSTTNVITSASSPSYLTIAKTGAGSTSLGGEINLTTLSEGTALRGESSSANASLNYENRPTLFFSTIPLASSSVNKIKISPNSGTIGGGFITLYGIKNS